MRTPKLTRFATLAGAFALAFCSFQASPEDIDIFSVDEDANVNNPNVLFVLDNSSNWSRQSQQWPGGEDQGQSEVDAIKTVIADLDDSINLGVMEFITNGSSGNQDSAFIRYHIRPMTTANKAALSTILTTIYNDINGPDEKRPQSNPFGNLMWDVYNYLGGFDSSQAGAGTNAARADASAYDTQYSNFRSPLTSNDTCARTIVVFIGNNVSTGPSADSTTNKDALFKLAEDANGTDAANATISQINFADYVVTTSNAKTDIARSSACFTTAAACTSAQNTTACTDEGFVSCSCDAADFVACPATHWNVTKTVANATSSSTSSTVNTADQYTGETTQCQKNAPNTACTLPPGTTTTSSTAVTGLNQTTTTSIATSWTGACAWGTNNVSCGPGGKVIWEPRGTEHVVTTVTVTDSSPVTTSLGETTACYVDQASCVASDVPGGCPAGATCACTTAGGTTSCAAGSTKQFMVEGNYTITAATQTGTFSAAPTGPFMMDEWARFLRQTGVPIPGLELNGVPIKTQVTTYTIDVFNAQQHPDFSGLLFNAARVGGGKYFQAKDKNSLINALRQILTEVQAVNSAFSSASLPVNATNRAQNENQVFIGVFKPNRTKGPNWFGNMKRYQLVSSGATIDLGDSNGDSAINTQTGFLTDCAVSFWTRDSGTFWNVVTADDPDALGICALNSTSDWSDSPDGPFVEKGAVAEVIRMGNTTGSPDSDGNYLVERNVYTAKYSATSPTAIGDLVDLDVDTFDDQDSGTDDTDEQLLVDYVRGKDVEDEDLDAKDLTLFPANRGLSEPRATIHGDVVHSRPQPINFGGTTGVVVFYGSNDGHYRAVKASNGQELWSFVAPEKHSKFIRLLKHEPIIRYFNDSPINTETKDYFFDGSTGVFQTFKSDNTADKVWIFPSLRRGGNRLYALDVSEPTKPKFMWSVGCDTLSCPSDFKFMGESWGLPNVAKLKGYCGVSTPCADSTTPRAPVIVMAGGYDACEDENTWEPKCSSTTGAGVYVIDAETGTLLRHFDFSALSGVSARSVAADVALIDVDNDELVDYGYAVDTGGNIYRFDFIDGPTSKTAFEAPEKWLYSRVAYTSGAGRKFLFPPALVQITASKVYLAIGTGDREHPLKSHYPYEDRNQDKDTTDGGIVNRFYVFKDDLNDVDETSSANLDDDKFMADYTKDTDCTTPAILPNSAEQGWFIELGENGIGEQVVTSAVVAAGFVFFSTNRPTDAATTACTTSLGEARGYFLNLLNASGAIGVSGACGGTRSSTFVGGGLPPSPVLATVPIDGEVRTVVIGAVQKTGEPSSPIQSQRVRPPIASDRKPIYWFKSTGDK